MKNKIFIIIGLVFIICFIVIAFKGTSNATKISDLDSFKIIDKNKIERITFTYHLESGISNYEFTDSNVINDIYNDLSSIVIKGKSLEAIDDDTLKINIHLSDGSDVSYLFEGNIIVFDDSRYKVEDISKLKDYKVKYDEKVEE